VAASPELPSLLQKRVDQVSAGVHLLVGGSSQRMMQGLVLDRSAPLFGRAHQVIEVGPLAIGWLPAALGTADARQAVEAFAVWGRVLRS
jgi:hypothetical protein